ncbi:MAG: methylenetetrahydrofolate reductase [NAD(P)H] [Planctomycetota bacterium]
MHITDLFQRDGRTVSFEFFPPKSAEAAETLYSTVTDLEALSPSFVSVTYGAGGSTRKLTNDLVVRLERETNLSPIPHLTCVMQSESDVGEILERYAEAGISNILALRGDPPVGVEDYDPTSEHFAQASDLVGFIQRFNNANGHRFGIGVAGFPEGHPGTPNRLKEMDYLKAKVDAGADYICTQLFFDNRDFYDFRDRCRLAGIKVPIIAGIMPITSLKGMERMAELALGARYPAPLLRALRRTNGDPDGVRSVGVHWATEQCRDLLDRDVDGLHLYTLNRSKATVEIYKTLGVRSSRQLASDDNAGGAVPGAV